MATQVETEVSAGQPTRIKNKNKVLSMLNYIQQWSEDMLWPKKMKKNLL